MATVSDLNLSGIVEATLALINQDVDSLSFGDDEFTLITRLANNAINRWEYDQGFLWGELWTNLTAATDGTKTITSGTSTYAAPTNFRFPGGWIRLTSGTEEIRYKVVKQHEAQKQSANSQQKLAYFTGNPGAGFTLNLVPTPDSTIDGWTINYDYYKLAEKLVSGADQPEMMDPFFIVYYVSSELVREEDPTRWKSFRDDAEEKLKQMEVYNMQYAPYQDFENEDAHHINTGLILGL
jgi:hypothetical protein